MCVNDEDTSMIVVWGKHAHQAAKYTPAYDSVALRELIRMMYPAAAGCAK